MFFNTHPKFDRLYKTSVRDGFKNKINPKFKEVKGIVGKWNDTDVYTWIYIPIDFKIKFPLDSYDDLPIGQEKFSTLHMKLKWEKPELYTNYVDEDEVYVFKFLSILSNWRIK